MAETGADSRRAGSIVRTGLAVASIAALAGLSWHLHRENERLESRVEAFRTAAAMTTDVAPGTGGDEAILEGIGRWRLASAMTRRLEEISWVTGGKEEEDVSLEVSAEKLAATRDRVLKALESGELAPNIPAENRLPQEPEEPRRVVTSYRSDLSPRAPDITNTLDYVVPGAMKRLSKEVERYAAAYGDAKRVVESQRAEISALRAEVAALRSEMEKRK